LDTIPTAFIASEYRLERKTALVTLTPFKMLRDPTTWKVSESPAGEVVELDPRHGHYMKLGEVLIALASASLVFIP
jgi:hypothetical protein